MILRRSKTDHYSCPLCFSLFGGGRGLSLRNLEVLGNSEGGEQSSWVWT